MQKKKSGVANRAWRILRLALLWARKGGVFRNRPMIDLRLFPKFLKSSLIGQSSTQRAAAIHYGERELSFEKTPIIHVKMHRPSSMRFRLPHIPCINPQVDFEYDYDFGNDDGVRNYYNGGARNSFLNDGDGEDHYEGNCEEMSPNCDDGDEGIDVKAEQFIAKFYEQIKMQRQVSYLHYNEMLTRGSS